MFLCERWEISGVYAIRYIRRINLIQSSSQNNEASECVFSLLQGVIFKNPYSLLKIFNGSKNHQRENLICDHGHRLG